MQIVIDISEELYREQLDGNWTGNYVIHDAIVNGTLLPKGHGKLKDVDAIMRELSGVSSRPVKSQMYIIEQAPTVVEADKTGEGEEE